MATEDPQSIEFLLGRLDAKVDLLLEANAQAAHARAELTERVLTLEKSISWVKGGAAVVAAISTALGAVAAWALGLVRAT